MRRRHQSLIAFLTGGLLAWASLSLAGQPAGDLGASIDAPRLVAWGHPGLVHEVHLSPDGRWLLTNDYEALRLWETETGRELRRLDPPGEELTAYGFSPDGRWVLVGSREVLHLRDPETGREAHRVQVDVGREPILSFSPDGKRLLVGGSGPAVEEEGVAVVWDLEAERELSRFPLPWPSYPHSFTAEGERIVIGNRLEGFQIWDWRTGRALRPLAENESHHASRGRSADGSRALVTHDAPHQDQHAAEVVDAATGRLIRRFEADPWLEVAVLSPDGSRLFLNERVLDVATGEQIGVVVGHGDYHDITCAAFSADGARVVTGGTDGTARLWDVETGRELRRFGARAGSTGPSHFSPDRRRLLVTGGDGTAHLWDTTTGRRLHRFGGHDDDARRAVFSPDGRRILTASRSGTARLWDAETGRELLRFEGHEAGLLEVTFSPDGRQVLTTSHDHTARLWDAETGREIRRFTGHGDLVCSAVFSPDGRRMATGSWDRTARLWDVETSREIRRFEHGEEDEDGVFLVRFVGDGRRLLTSVRGRSPLRLWDVETGEALGEVGEAGNLFSVSDDGRQVLIVNRPHIDLWDLEAGRLSRRFEELGHTLTHATLSADGARLLVGEFGGTLRILDTETGDRLGTVLMFTTGGWAVVDPEGRYDTSDPDDLQGLYWMVETDVHPLGHFRVEYHDPGLLGKLLGHNPQPLRTIPRPAIVDF